MDVVQLSGMPRFRRSGSLRHYGVKYRFMLTETTGEDPVKVLDRPGKALSLKTATSLGISATIHSRECIHALVKASTLLLRIAKGDEGKVYLVDFGLAFEVEEEDDAVLWMMYGFLACPVSERSGSLKHYGVKYRFMLTETTGEDPVKVLDRPGKALSLKTATSLGISVTIHSRECIHDPVKASTMLLGIGKGDEGKVYLADFGLACRYTQNEVEEEDDAVLWMMCGFLACPVSKGLDPSSITGSSTRSCSREDPVKVLDRPGKVLSLKTATSLGISVTIHSRECIHAPVKASTLLLGIGKGDEGKVYLVDFGLACRYTQNGMQKILGWQGKTLSLKTGFSLGTRVIDVLENVQNNKCIQADMESPKLLPAFGKDNENKLYIMDCGLTCPFMPTGKHKEHKEDVRKADEGASEFTS
ncbi:hypothetical protein MTO96_024948 [Rhipicephalus appendiculatus]